jgi:hypothetical protein
MKSQPFADNRISYGPQVFPAPRKSNAWKDRYAWTTNIQPEPALVRSLRLRMSERYGVPFNSVQCNWHDGTSGVKPHCDPYRVVAMVRVGAERCFEVGEQRRNGGNNFKPYLMPHGSLITFLSGGAGAQDVRGPGGGSMRQPRVPPRHAAADGRVVARQADLRQEQGGAQEAVRRESERVPANRSVYGLPRWCL